MFSRKRRERRGNYSALMFSLIEIVVGFGALSVDVSLITMSELQVQATADAAAHAALVKFHKTLSTGDAQAAAEFVVSVNSIGMGTGRLDKPVELGNWDYVTRSFLPGLQDGFANAARANVSRSGDNAVDLLLAPILNVRTAEVEGEAVTSQQQRAIMLVVDMSCSMMTDTGQAVKDSRTGAITFLDYMVSHPQGGDKFGMAMFAQYGTKAGSLASPWRTLVASTPPWIPLATIAGNTGALYAGLDGICNTMYSTNCGTVDAPHPRSSDIGSCTYPGIAISQATTQLKAVGASYFRGIVLMSDGLPNCGTINPIAAADAAWAEDVNIWTIVFHNGTFDASFMASLTRGIGFSQVSPSSADLPEMYRQVAESLPTAFVK